jgi:hypothetical protein
MQSQDRERERTQKKKEKIKKKVAETSSVVHNKAQLRRQVFLFFLIFLTHIL